MTILGIETATTVCGAAVASKGRILAEESLDERFVHAERLMNLIDRALNPVHGLAGVEGIAVSIGPGSFTGLRIGVSVAKGLAFARSLRIVPVPTLLSLIERARPQSADGRRIVAMLQARRGEFYVQADGEESSRVLSLDQIPRQFPIEQTTFTGETTALAAVRSGVPPMIVKGTATKCSAATIALMGERLFSAGFAVDAESLEPEYTLDFFLKPSVQQGS